MSTYKIFIASPSDVATERNYAEEVINEFNARIADNLGVTLRVLRWERATPDLGDAQDLINEKAATADLVILIFWSRVGSPTANHLSGTLEEFEKAYTSWKEVGRPRVWVYLRNLDEMQRRDPGPQLENVLAFRRRFESGRLGLSFSYTDPASFRYWFQTHLHQAIIQAALPSEQDEQNDSPSLSVMRTVSKIARNGMGIWAGLHRYSTTKQQLPAFERPVVINPRKDPVQAYADGLSTVTTRFWTTAFLDSVYWDGTDPTVLTANKSMLKRIQRNRGSARRLLVAAEEPAQEAKWIASHLRLLKDSGRHTEATERKRQFEYLREAMTKLADAGFETRVGCDKVKHYSRVSIRIDGEEIDPRKFGITLYDDVRLDIFQEGKFGLAGSVSCFTPATRDFDVIREQAEQYFEKLWSEALPFAEFLNCMDEK